MDVFWSALGALAGAFGASLLLPLGRGQNGKDATTKGSAPETVAPHL
jgi:hypothetical protein